MSAGWTVREAAEQLDPPMDEVRVRHMIAAFGYEPIGQRASGGRGRPVPEYDQADLMRAHAAVTAVAGGLLLGVICPPLGAR
ncbi:hypothetical protein ACFYUV_38195 [Nonomuraea sp. NPDC003560]|uniref:hypothetical protein n=1 Tax=Nonomuraea sp. NPDC003560 TaxID=3364341 RepID=UPI0036CB62A1